MVNSTPISQNAKLISLRLQEAKNMVFLRRQKRLELNSPFNLSKDVKEKCKMSCAFSLQPMIPQRR